MGDEVTVVLSPAQLAAVLSDAPIDAGETRSNRLWGGVTAIAGSLEMVGAAALLLAPEPTGATKVGGYALGAYGADVASTGLWQLWTGQPQKTLTNQAAAALARSLGADPETADNIGTGVDIAVPVALSLGLGAMRIAAIRAGRISLIEHEAEAVAPRLGGHTILKHVAKTEPELRARVADELAKAARTGRRAPEAISSFRSLEVAEKTLYQALKASRTDIENWARTAAPGAKKAFTYAARDNVGFGVETATGKLVQMRNVKFVLKMEAYNGKLFYILTSHPMP